MRLPLTVFLVREGINPVRIVSPSSLEHGELFVLVEGRLDPIDADDPEILDAAQPGDVVVILFQRPSSVPAWQRFIADALARPSFGAPGQSLGAIVFCAAQDPRGPGVRWMAWCFGSGSRCIRRPVTDARFGLLVALNTLAVAIAQGQVRGGRGPQLRSLQYRTTTPYFQQTGHRATRDIPVDAFRFDRQSDLVSVVGGETGDAAIPVVLGGRSFSCRTDVESVGDLVDLSSDLLQRAGGDEYKAGYGWIDNITPVFDEVLVSSLRAEVVGRLREEPVPANVDVLLPDDYPDFDDRSIQYVLLPRELRRTASRVTMTVDRIGQLVRGSDSSAEVLDLELRFLDASRDEVTSASVLECLCADVEMDGQQYIAYDGDFYAVDRSFVQGVNDEVRRIDPSQLPLPNYRGGDEPSYFEHVREEAPDEFVILDRALLREAAERGGIEAADLLSRAGALVHVKRKGKSSVLSHLFFQAGNSCELLRQSPDARDQLVTLVEGSGASPALIAEVCPTVAGLSDHGLEPEVTFAFLGDWRDRDATALPLFSKISLIQAARRVRQLRFHPTVALIDQAA